MAQIDETNEFPAENVKKMAELGLLGMFVPEGSGAGMTYLAYVVAIEELSRVGCASHGDRVREQLARLLPARDVREPLNRRSGSSHPPKGEKLGAYCPTEPNAGSNAANQQTTAVLDGDHRC